MALKLNDFRPSSAAPGSLARVSGWRAPAAA
jgi:hypothetical protein